MFMIARRQPPVKQNPQSFLHCRKIAENRRKTQKSCKFNLQTGCGLESKTIWNGFRFFRVAAPSIRIVPWAARASCWPLPQQLLPVSAAGGGRSCCIAGWVESRGREGGGVGTPLPASGPAERLCTLAASRNFPRGARHIPNRPLFVSPLKKYAKNSAFRRVL